MELVDALCHLAEDAGHPLRRLSAGRDRYGPVDALLLTAAMHVGVHRRAAGGYDVAVWNLGNLHGWGTTSDLNGILATMYDVQQHNAEVDQLTPRPFLATAAQAGTAAAIEAEWQLHLRYGDDALMSIVSAAGADVRLRQHRPCISHGTLHLLAAPGIIGHSHAGLAFDPDGTGRYRIRPYDGSTAQPVESIEQVIARASSTVATWQPGQNS